MQKSSTSMSIPEFVIQEAREKCYEIEVKALKEYEKAKDQIMIKENEIIKEEFSKKSKSKEQEFRINNSTAINRSRLLKMEARDRAMMKIFSDLQFRIYQQIQEDKSYYATLLKKLIIQGLIKMMPEKKIWIRCLQDDYEIVGGLVNDSKKEFLEIARRELEDPHYDVVLTLDTNKYLIPRIVRDNSTTKVADFDVAKGHEERISKNEEDKQCFGGIILTNEEGNVICKNTLDVRCDLCLQDSLPTVREIMFPSARK